ncbi:MAG: response regulator transcription factor [Candidatus Eremiobacteraeota bacterium]|nr:response regulator transcription factor [Candidatus Eremiobacteraeota bacterium]
MRVLLVEDNTALASAMCGMLDRRKIAVDTTGDGAEGLDWILRQTYDVAVVDVGLPTLDGFSLVERARKDGLQTPVLFLTARDAVEDRVRGLQTGDDYLVKPFLEEELVARLHALVRRRDKPIQQELRCGRIVFDPFARTVSVDGASIDLGATEFRLLEFLMRNAGIACSREQLLERLWDYEFDGSSNIVDVYVSQLRRKLKRFGIEKSIETVWGVGYRLKA